MLEWFDCQEYSTNGKTNKVILRNAKLKRQYVHFPIGTIFKEISINECCVVYLNIEGKEQHFFELPGYNYLASLNFIVEGRTFNGLLGRSSLFYGVGKEDTNLRTTSTGFKLDKVVCSEDEELQLYPKDTKLTNVDIDLQKGIITAIKDGETVIHKFSIDIPLRIESIPMNYLKDLNEWTKRKTRHFDVKNPPALQKLVDNYETEKERNTFTIDMKVFKFEKSFTFGGTAYVVTLREINNINDIKHNYLKKGVWKIYKLHNETILLHESIAGKEEIRVRFRRVTVEDSIVAVVSRSLVREINKEELSKIQIKEALKTVSSDVVPYLNETSYMTEGCIFTRRKNKQTIAIYLG